LECHHLDLAFGLLREEKNDIFKRWPEDLRQKVEAVVRDAVLATDMALHNSFTDELERRALLPKPFDFSLLEERMAYFKFLLHAADIFNAARPFDVCKRIAAQLVEEFQNQVELERSRGLPSAPFMVIENELSLCKGEKSFAQHVARPYFAALSDCFPDKEALRQVVQQIDTNVDSWQREIEALSTVV
jgi:3'5'-cyclic nucleotide phosphodiesterase